MQNEHHHRLRTAGLLIGVTVATTLLPNAQSLAQVSTVGSPGTGTTPYAGGTSTVTIGTAPQLPAASPSGIPLGALELDPGGLNSFQCSNPIISSSGMIGSAPASSSTFDGGGLTACSAPAFGASSSAPAIPSTATGSSATSAGIPLGSSEINNAGVSPILGLPTTTTSDPVTSPAVTIP